MTNKKCSFYDKCSAPLCPLNESNMKNCIWYPDEEICKNREFSNLEWIKRQRKIAKRAKRIDRYFTFEMLNHDCIIAKGIEGLDPDKPEKPQLTRWFEKHPPISDQTRKTWQKNISRARNFK